MGAVKSSLGNTLTLTARPNWQGDVGFAFTGLHGQPRQWSFPGCPFLCLCKNLAETIAPLFAEIQPHYGVKNDGCNSRPRLRQLRFEPGYRIRTVHLGRYAPGDFDRIREQSKTLRLVGPHKG